MSRAAFQDLSYGDVGSTRVRDADWRARPRGYRASERTVAIGRGDSVWAAACDALLSWGLVAVVDEADRCGFASGTRPGHPIAGEEAFIVFRTDDGVVWMTLRSLTQNPLCEVVGSLSRLRMFS